MLIECHKEVMMWTCVHCGLEVMFSATETELDNENCYFICPSCDGRNRLDNMSKDGEQATVLGQPPDD